MCKVTYIDLISLLMFLLDNWLNKLVHIPAAINFTNFTMAFQPTDQIYLITILKVFPARAYLVLVLPWVG